jgi:hypothetical protein
MPVSNINNGSSGKSRLSEDVTLISVDNGNITIINQNNCSVNATEYLKTNGINTQQKGIINQIKF